MPSTRSWTGSRRRNASRSAARSSTRRVYVVDEHLSPVPLGAPGLIVFAGVCVGRGYVNDPERTARMFDDRSPPPGRRVCRTGDYGRWRPDGKLDFLGRRDNQVKIRGFRIEIGEVENALLRVPGVRDGAAVVAEGADRTPRLVAFYAGDRPAAVEDLRERLAEVLPEYMVPAAFHWRAGLPLTPNGKIDRTTLTALAGTLDTADADAPRTPTELRLAAAWAAVLGAPPGPDRPPGRLLRPGRHLAVIGEARDRPGPGGVTEGPRRLPRARRPGRPDRRPVLTRPRKEHPDVDLAPGAPARRRAAHQRSADPACPRSPTIRPGGRPTTGDALRRVVVERGSPAGPRPGAAGRGPGGVGARAAGRPARSPTGSRSRPAASTVPASTRPPRGLRTSRCACTTSPATRSRRPACCCSRA